MSVAKELSKDLKKIVVDLLRQNPVLRDDDKKLCSRKKAIIFAMLFVLSVLSTNNLNASCEYASTPNGLDEKPYSIGAICLNMENLIPNEHYSHSGIYCIENKINGKKYIGSAIHFGRRFNHHNGYINRGDNKCGLLQQAANKYGSDNLKMYIIEVVQKELVSEREQYWIDMIRPKYNLRLKNVHSNIGLKWSDETKKKIGLASIGRTPPNKGKKTSRETIEKAKKNRTVFRKKGEYTHSIETRKKISASHIGMKKEWMNRKFTLEHKKNLSISHIGVVNKENCKSILQYNLNGEFIKEWVSAREASRVDGFNYKKISSVARGNERSHKGFIFKFKNT